MAVTLFKYPLLFRKPKHVEIPKRLGVRAVVEDLFVCLFGFVALRPLSTAMVIAGRSVHFTTLFPGQA